MIKCELCPIQDECVVKKRKGKLKYVFNEECPLYQWVLQCGDKIVAQINKNND